MPKLVILDGNSLLYRGFFAMRVLTTSDGLPTNAVYSFVMMLLTILDREKPDCLFAAFDPPVPTFRHIELPSYKGTRKEMPDDLKPQRQYARDAARAFGVPVVEVDGYEADDVVGTLAQRAKAAGYEVLIVTGDGDMLQIVDDEHGPVRVMITIKGVTDTVVYDEAKVQERYGLTPSQIPDLKGLKGDSSDNLPGVPGIGEKGAIKLLQQYGTVENLIEHAADLPDRQRLTLQENAELARQCKRLATIDCGVPLPDDVQLTNHYQIQGIDFPAARALLDRLEFRGLAKRVAAMESEGRAQKIAAAQNTGDLFAEAVQPPVRDASAHRTVTTPEEFDELHLRLTTSTAPIGAMLHVTPDKSSLIDAALTGIAFGWPDIAYYADWETWAERLAPLLQDSKIRTATHDVKTATAILRRHGIPSPAFSFDTLLAAYLINAGRASYPIATIVEDYAKIELVQEPSDPVANLLDQASAISAVVEPMRARLERDQLVQVFEEIELPLSSIIADIELRGVRVDRDRLVQTSEELGRQVREVEAEIHEIAGGPFSVGSTKQLQEVLFEKLQLKAGKKTKTGYSTGVEVLEELAAQGHEIARKVITWRELTKLKSTYADSLPTLISPTTQRIHTTLSQTVASTGRLSSSNPNLQNIPIRTPAGREIRKAFVPAPGRVFVSADYSQIELRIFAHITGDPELVEAFRTDEDIHVRTARMIFNVPDDVGVTGDQRRQAKTINFAVLYGASPYRVSVELGIPQAVSAGYIKRYFELYPSVKQYVEDILAEARECGYVKTLLGRRRYVPDLNSQVYQFRQSAEREAANMPVQGTSADIIKIAMIRVDRALRDQGLDAEMILQVHDELVFECAPEQLSRLAALVKDCMENAYPLAVPVRAEVKSGCNWWDVTPVDDIDAQLVESLT